MPTGYTAPIEERDVSFEEFVWRCARAFGALAHMREDDTDAQIPDKVPASTYYTERIAETVRRRAELDSMTVAEATRREAEEYRAARSRWTEAKRQRKAATERYWALQRQVENWNPPTPEHAGLRDFMLDQIRISMTHLAGSPAPMKHTPNEWLEKEREWAAREERHCREQAEEERHRVAARQAWLDALRAAVPPPPVAKKGG